VIKSILPNLLIALLALVTVPVIGQSNLLNLEDITDISKVDKLFRLFSAHSPAQSQLRSSSVTSQIDYLGYTLSWNYEGMAYDSTSRSELITEEVDGKTNWALVQDLYDGVAETYLPAQKIEVFNANIGIDEDPEDGTVIPADSLFAYTYDDATQEYTLFLSSYYFANAFGKLDYAEFTIYFYGLPFFSTVQQNYYDEEERLIATITGDGISTQDSIVFSYNDMEQLTQQISFSFDYGVMGGSAVTDYSYNGDETLAFVRNILYSDWLTTIVGKDSTTYKYPSPDMYTETVYYYDDNSGGYMLDYYWDFTSTEDKEFEEKYVEGDSGLVNVEYIQSTFDECDRIVEGLNVGRLIDGTEDTRELSLFFYREEPSCTVSTNEAEPLQNQFTYLINNQMLTVLLEESDRGILTMFSTDGRPVAKVKYDGVHGEVDVSQLAAGIYYVSVAGQRIHGVFGVFVK